MLTPYPLISLIQQQHEHEIETSYLARLAARVRECCRPGRLARIAALIHRQPTCIEGACA
jgi:hypothetical protein